VKRVYVEGYDTYVRFPDGVSDEEMQKALAEHYPETDDQFVARIKDPTTQADEVSFDDYKRYRELDTGMELLDAPGVIVQAAGIAAKELYNGAKAAVKLGLQGEGGKAAASLAEGATRGTSDLTALGARIGEGVYQHLEPYFKDSGDVEIDRYHRFLALKSLDNIREAARAGDETLLEEFGLTPDMIDNDLAEGSSYFLDPSMVVGFGSGKITQLAARAASKPVRMTGAALTKTAQGIRGVADKLSGVKASATQTLNDATAGYGKYAGAGIAGAAATSLGAGPALGAAGTALLGLPALEVGGAALSAFGDAMRNTPSRIGGLRQLALDTPDTLAGKVAGQLQFLDKPIEYLGRAAGGAAVGAGVGSGIGLLAGGIEGAAQGFGAGFSSGAVGGIAGRLTEGLRGTALRRAEVNDYQNWRSRVDKPLGEYFDRYFTDHSSRIKGMDLVQLVQTAAAEKNYNVQILEPKDYDARFKNNSEGVQLIEGQQPVVYLRGVFDGKNGKDSALRVLAHEVFHTIARLDGFDVLAARIGQEAAAMYSKDEIGQFIRTYEGKLDGKRGNLTETNQNKIIEELAAEYFADLIVGKDSSYILQGDGITASVRNMMARLIPGKLSRVIEAFESPVFGPMKQANPALRRALGDLVKARRKAYKNVMLGDGTPIRVYNETDLGNDEIYKELEALGAAYTDNKGRRQMLKPAAEKRIEKDRAQAVAAALDKVPTSTVDAEGGGLVRQPDGSYVGNRFSPSQIQAIINEPGMPNKIIEVMQVIDQAQGVVNTTYAAATAKVQRKGAKNKGKFVTRYRNLPYSNRDAALYQIVVSPSAGTMRVEALDMSFLQAKAATNWESNPAWQQAFGNVDSMISDLKTYINALGGNTPTAQVLGSEAKRNLLNKFLGVRNVRGNPLISPEYKVKEGEHPWRAFRLDRIIAMKARNEATPTRFSQRAYEQAQGNFSPAATDVDQLGMYSKAERAIKDLKQERGTGQQFMAALEKAGVKQEEIAETGLDKFLEDNPRTTKEDVLNHLLANQIEVNETVLGGRRVLTPDEQQRLAFLEAENAKKPLGAINDTVGDGAFEELLTLQNIRDGMSTEDLTAAQRILERQRRWTEANHLTARIENLELSGDFEDRTKYSRYTAPGSEQGTYRERLLTIPYENFGDSYRSQHFEPRNIVAHVRHNTRIGNLGERVLFIEEIQSDWHQEGRRKGYNTPAVEAKNKAKSIELNEELRKLEREYESLIKRKFAILESPREIRDSKESIQEMDRLQELADSNREQQRGLNNRIFKADYPDIAPDAPFKKTWPELSMKRMLRVAAEEGFDAIAWTTGDVQASRYDLSKQVQRLEYNEVSQLLRGFKTGESGGLYPVLERNIAPNQLPDYIGKELSQKLLGQKIDGSGNHVIDGDDIKVDSGGMKGFYDRILPTLKTWKQVKGKDGERLKVQMHGVGKGLKGHYVKLTPEHRASILEQGLPRFSPGSTELTQSRSLNDRGGAIYTNERGDRAIQLSSRSGVRVYSDRGKRIGPVFSSVEKAQDYLSRR